MDIDTWDLIRANGMLNAELAKERRDRGGPTERQLEWMRQHIPHFETCEKQARAARER